MRGSFFEGKRIGIKRLIGYLEEQTMTPVLDKTGLDGRYDILLDWQYENTETIYQELAKYGLALSRVHHEVPVEYLRISK